MHFTFPDPFEDLHDGVIKVETLMAELGVNICDLEIVNHVRNVLDVDGDAPYGDLAEEDAFALACRQIDHTDLDSDYEYIASKQRDLVSDALDNHRRSPEESRFRSAAQDAHDVFRAAYEEEVGESPRTDEPFEEGAVWGRGHRNRP